VNDILIELSNQINIPQLLCIGLMFWFFYQRLDAKISDVDRRQSAKIEDLDKKINDIDKRLCRIEGSLSTHGSCLFNQNECVKKID
jgi:hypothetical protein